MAVLSFLTYLRGIYKLNLNTSSRVHYAIIQSIYDCFIMSRDDLDLSKIEMSLSTATGSWLDYWGEFFSIYRKSGEQDDHFSQRIIDDVIQPKSTIPAIKDNIVDYLNSTYNKDYTREDILVREPWKELAKYSQKGGLSNNARFYSPDFYTHAILDINIPEEVSDDLIDLVKSIKAAGVKVLWSILNQYDIIDGFGKVNEAWASYTRLIQSYVNDRSYNGLMLSNSSKHPLLSGTQDIWFDVRRGYDWWANFRRLTDNSFILTKTDLIGLIDGYRNPSNPEEIIPITDEFLDTLLEDLNKWMASSRKGKLSTSSGEFFEYDSSEDVWKAIMEAINEFKTNDLSYYNSVQSPITNKEQAMWYVKRHKNWLWDTPLMTMSDFYTYWEPLDGYEEHTINSIIEAEERYYDGYLTFGDTYQAPIVVVQSPII